MQRKKVILIIIDGWGYNEKEIKYDAIRNADTTWMDLLIKKFPSFLLHAHGPHVGLPEGQMGNSEVGHLTIGSGRILEQDIVRINREISQEKMSARLEFLDELKDERLHIIGLLSDGGVHSHINHIKSLIRNAPNKDVLIHAISDGRDTNPQCFLQYYKELNAFCNELKKGAIVSVSGRYYTMDRDNRLDRTNLAHKMMTQGNITGENIEDIIHQNYSINIFDETIPPTMIKSDGRILKGEPVIFANFRADRMKQIVKKFEFTNRCFTLTEYDASFNVKPIFEKIKIKNCLTEVFANDKIRNLHIAETEKYAHVTYFFNGGIEKQFEYEDRILVPSPKIATYDLKPEMSIFDVVENAIKGMKENYDFIVCNFAPPDMVGHTGNYEKTCDAVLATDEAIGLVFEGSKNFDYTLFITADHGNAEIMRNEKNERVTKHTKNPVPFIICDGSNKTGQFEKGDYSLKDVAPTILSYMNLEIPDEMEGRDIFTLYNKK